MSNSANFYFLNRDDSINLFVEEREQSIQQVQPISRHVRGEETQLRAPIVTSRVYTLRFVMKTDYW